MRHKISLAGLTAAIGFLALASGASALPATTDMRPDVATKGMVEQAAHRHHRPGIARPGLHHRPGRHPVIVRPRPGVVVVRPWKHRKHFGRLVAGVAIGTVIAAAAAGAAPTPPAPNLCWYWTNPSKTNGYWDYCE
jgi:hypothetical protein